MARTIQQIFDEITASVAADTELSGQLTSTSKVAVWRLWAWVVATAIWAVEVLFDNHKAEVQAIIDAGKPHTLRWYRQKALDYQHGGTLVVGEDYYDNTGLSDSQIAAQKIVKQAAATETGGLVTVKVAKTTPGDGLQELETSEYNGVAAYFAEIKDAGVYLNVLTAPGDNLRVTIDIFYDPLILDANGARLDGTAATPVRDAIKNYVKNLPFDGLFMPQKLVDAVQAVEGVRTLTLRVCDVKRNDDATWTGAGKWYSPYSGYLVLSPTETNLYHLLD